VKLLYDGTVARAAVVTPNRRGVRSRELVLDAAERLMAEHGYEAATVAALKEEAGIPMSSIYHYFGSKDGVLRAVMERGSERLLADLTAPTTRPRRTVERLRATVETFAEAFDRNSDFLRLLVAMAAQPPRTSEVLTVMNWIREKARVLLRDEIRLAFGPDTDEVIADRLAHFAHAAIDGAFVSQQIEPDVSLHTILAGLPAALVAIRRELENQGRTASNSSGA
jgi:AcrR family transcriptional regulator